MRWFGLLLMIAVGGCDMARAQGERYEADAEQYVDQREVALDKRRQPEEVIATGLVTVTKYEPAMQAGWAPLNTLRYWRNQVGDVRMTGVVQYQGGTSWAFTLPAGYRTASPQIFFPIWKTGHVVAFAIVYSNGEVHISGTLTYAHDFDMGTISFLAEQ